MNILTKLLLEITRDQFNSTAKLYANKLSNKDLLVLRSWVITGLWDSPPPGYISRKDAAAYMLSAKGNLIKITSQNFIKRLYGTEKFKVYRSYSPDTPSKNLKSYSLKKGQALLFNPYSGILDTKIITYNDVIAVPAISFKGWKEEDAYDNELEIILNPNN